ncbi:substrate-binding periplasmic protein [Roseateles toxinivorans]|uniref:Amino acid ABC transporter substrate-binding protein (PAAT family) n=1 Tax=Roseateles toxinivorans TaxID=270368 RepID=A0A4R6QHS0_9BURK|nr:ABC transporter substrate-binding protein [Roseateles toxinivorans]TDP62741.1 amino acid ABC transporter substrate-binding protein (PAAT family) [Roseateles toxinivorans]
MKRLAFSLLVMSAPVWAADVSMAFGEKIPPFSFPETSSGIEIEIIGEALAVKGHVLKPRYFPFARVPLAFKDGVVDAAMTDLGQDLRAAGAHYGDPAVLYDNVFFTLRSRGLQLRKPADLNGLTLVSFQGAANRYPEWLGPMKKAGNYVEVNDQAVQVKMLMLGRIDVVLSDRSIFRYFSLQLQRSGVALEAVDEQPFTAVNPQDYRPVFRSKQVRDDFNQGLLQIRKNGRYKAIYDKYLRE